MHTKTKGGETMKKAILIALVLGMLLSVACVGNSWKITSWTAADEFPVYTLKNGNNVMLGVPAGGSKPVPPVGAKCKLSGMIFDCGGKWQKLNAYYPPPV